MRKLSVRLAYVMAGIAFVSIALAVSVAVGDSPPEAKTVGGIKNIMNAVNHEEHGFYAELKKFLDGNPGKGDKSWKLLRHKAVVMGQLGNTLLELTPPKGANDAAGMTRWKTHAASFRDECMALSKQIALRKVDKAKEKLAVVTKRCDTCHADHRAE